MLEDRPVRDAELRLALGMRGGVSLAVWIGGACAEIDALRRASLPWRSAAKPGDTGAEAVEAQASDEADAFWRELLDRSDYSAVVVDVMAGASAGGLNGVLFASAIRHGFRMDQLLGIWRTVASVADLIRDGEPWLSLFDGDARFLDVIREALEALIATATPLDEDLVEKAYVDLQLSATLVEPIEQKATSPSDEVLRRRRSDARFHFRHDPSAALPRTDLESVSLPQLAVAARATASFPFAFEAAVVRSIRPERFDSAPRVPQQLAMGPAARLADCHGYFSESRGKHDRVDPLDDDDFLVADGGIVDNIPLGKALDGIRDAPAKGPTRRVLVYLHPNGPSATPALTAVPEDETMQEAAQRRRGPKAVVRGLIAARLQGESIDGDLDRVEHHNRRVRLGALLREALLEDLDEHARTRRSTRMNVVESLARTRVAAYRAGRGDADAESVQRLLRDPLAVLGEDPFPRTADGDDERWRAPWACWESAQRQNFDLAIRRRFGVRLRSKDFGAGLMLAGLGPLLRARPAS